MSQLKNIERWLGWVTAISICSLVLVLLYSSRKPLCIESKLIDKIVLSENSLAYRCSLSKTVPVYGYLEEQLDFITEAIRIENFLASLAPFKSHLRIHIYQEAGTTYLLQDGVLLISKNIFETRGILEKTLVKMWLRDRNPVYFANDLLAEEIFSDLILRIAQGRFQIDDPFSDRPLSTASQKWPTILKTVSGYCQSDWKISEHFLMCANLNKNGNSIGHEMIDFSLRPLLSSAWIDVYSKLTLKEKIEFTRVLPEVVSSFELNQGAFLDLLRSSTDEPWISPFLYVQRLNQLWTTSLSRTSVPTYRHIIAELASSLQAKGFKQMIEATEFDLVYQSDEVLPMQSPRVKSLYELAKKNPELRILVRDPLKVWIMPTSSPVSIDVMRTMKSHRMVLETCKKIDFAKVISFSEQTSKLLVVRNCDLKKSNYYQGFVDQGAEGFALQNQASAFVQFHLPSLLLKQKDLAQAGDVFRFVRQREVDSPSFKSLGWRELNWNSNMKTYQPKGFVDAIELFRVNSTEPSQSVSNL